MYSILRKGCSSAFRFCRLFSNVRALVVWLLCWSAAQAAEFQVASTSLPESQLSTVSRDAGYTDLDLETRFAAYQAVDKRDAVPESLISQAVQIGRETPWAAAGYFNASGSPLFFPGRSPRKCGYGADLNRVPFFVGDGCGPGASSSQMVAGRATWIAEGLSFDAGNSQLVGPTTNSLLYNLPNNPSVETIGGGFVPPTPIPGANSPAPTTIGITNPVQSGVGGTLSFSGNSDQIAQGQSYQAGASNYFQTQLAPGSSGTTVFNAADSGAIQTSAGPDVYSSFAYDMDNKDNQRLFNMLCSINQRRSGLITLLRDSFYKVLTPEVRLHGCYFCATGRASTEQGFIRGVLDKLPESQGEVAWTPQLEQSQKRSKFLGWGFIVGTVVLVAATAMILLDLGGS